MPDPKKYDFQPDPAPAAKYDFQPDPPDHAVSAALQGDDPRSRGQALGAEAMAKEPRPGAAADSGALSGATFGYDDRIYGALAGIGHALAGGDYHEGYEHYKNERRQQGAQLAKDNPQTSTVGTFGGAMAGGAALGE